MDGPLLAASPHPIGSYCMSSSNERILIWTPIPSPKPEILSLIMILKVKTVPEAQAPCSPAIL